MIGQPITMHVIYSVVIKMVAKVLKRKKQIIKRRNGHILVGLNDEERGWWLTNLRGQRI